ncbi:MAG: DUF433 domain-containing protein [Saprospiraceae bacterium]|nr:DUF433 domain-containing protein [Saprospiraceae bacterium]
MITRDPKILLGKPIIKGTRISVELILRKLASGYTVEQVLSNYPHLTIEQIQACKFATAKIARLSFSRSPPSSPFSIRLPISCQQAVPNSHH